MSFHTISVAVGFWKGITADEHQRNEPHLRQWVGLFTGERFPISNEPHLRQWVGLFTGERFPISNEPHPLTQVVLTGPPLK